MLKKETINKLFSVILTVILVLQPALPVLAEMSRPEDLDLTGFQEADLTGLSNLSGLGSALEISITDSSFEPSSLTVDVGTEVSWTNNGNQVHRVQSKSSTGISSVYLPIIMRTISARGFVNPFGSTRSLIRFSSTDWDSGKLQPGENFSFTFNSVGTYDYYDPLHATMTGQVIVQKTNESPIVTITSPDEGTVIQPGESIEVSGTVSDDGTVVKVLVNDIEATLTDNNFKATISLSSDTQVINVVAEDDQGALGLASRVVGVDTQGPLVEISAPPNRQSIYSTKPTIAVSYNDLNSTVKADSVTVSLTNQNGTATDVSTDLSINETGAQGTVSSSLADDTVC